MKKHVCPRCGEANEDNWPLRVDGEFKDGGCQDCWETECAIEFWEMMKDEERIAIGVLSDER